MLSDLEQTQEPIFFKKILEPLGRIWQTSGEITYSAFDDQKKMPWLDYLIREAVQNSSDASLGVRNPYYEVDFTVGEFEPKKLNQCFESIGDVLNAKYSQNNCKFLEIRDRFTVGLNGSDKPITQYGQKSGNYQRLILGTGERQQQIGGGGNFGFGKAVYYEMGIGLVIFYSQIEKKDQNTTEARLIVSFIERDAHFLRKIVENNSTTGKGFWAQDKDSYGNPIPFKDKTKIKNFLSIFGISPFAEDETGTAIIIPYLRTEELLDDIRYQYRDEDKENNIWEEDEIDRFKFLYCENIQKYLELALQKWYAPKLDNTQVEKFGGGSIKYLKARINGKEIKKENFIPFFRLVQEMYNCAFLRKKSELYNEIDFRGNVKTKGKFINVSSIGTIATARVNIALDSAELLPLNMILRMDFREERNIAVYTRDLGMIIEYTSEQKWVPDTNQGRYIAFFKPDTSVKFREDYKQKDPLFRSKQKIDDLGEYLRNCEDKTHSYWSPLNVVQSIQQQVKKALRSVCRPIIKSSTEEQKPISYTLGNYLLPRKTKSSQACSQNKNRSRQLYRLSITPHYRDRGIIDLKVQLIPKNEYLDYVILQLGIESDGSGGKMNSNKWKEDFPNRPFPLSFNFDKDKSSGLTCNFHEGDKSAIELKLPKDFQIDATLEASLTIVSSDTEIKLNLSDVGVKRKPDDL